MLARAPSPIQTQVSQLGRMRVTRRAELKLRTLHFIIRRLAGHANNEGQRTHQRSGIKRGPPPADASEWRTVAWILLISAGILEIGFAVSLKASHGFTRPIPMVLFAVCAIASFALLSLALRDLPVGTAYAVWTGIGAAGTAIVGMVALDESADALRIVAIAFIVTGAIALQAVEIH